MAVGRSARTGCLIALWTFVSAGAQTTAPEIHAPEPSQGQQVSPLPRAGETGQLVQRFIADRLAVWRQRLKLEGWRISVTLTRRNDLKPKTLGGIRWDKGKKSAVIWVLDPSDYRLPFREMLDDMESTIVHELVHLQLASLPRSEAGRSSEEHAVNGIAEALLNLDRQKVAVPANTPGSLEAALECRDNRSSTLN